jgi:serine/threonine-protein kinase
MNSRTTAPVGDAKGEVDRVGAVLSGKYRVLKELGAGGMGTVYLAEHVEIGRRVAVKVLNSAFAGQSDAVNRFQREARAAAQIGHPNIVEILDMGRTDEGVPYMVMELLEGEDLLKLMGRTGRIPPGQAVDIVVQVLSAIGVAHAIGIIHRDLKPENVFLARRGARTDFVKVLDFGVAKFHDAISSTSGRLTRDGTLVGTPAYMSPEQARGSKKVDARSDLYAVGVVMYEMLSSRLPHSGESYNEMIVAIAGTEPPGLSTVAPWVPPGLSKVVARAMARDPDARFQTASQMSDALQPFVEAVEIDVPLATGTPPVVPAPTVAIEARPSMSTAVQTTSSRARLPLVAAAAALVLVVAGAGAYWALAPTDGAAHAEDASASPLVVPSPPVLAAPPATAAPAGVVSLDVESNAPGARVLLDGEPVGVAPLHSVVPERGGMHVLRVEAEGFAPAERTVPLSGPVRISIDLQPLGGPAPAPAKRAKRPGKAPGLLYDEDVY